MKKDKGKRDENRKIFREIEDTEWAMKIAQFEQGPERQQQIIHAWQT